MQRYLCEFPIQGANNENIRHCFTGSVKGISPYALKSYAEAYRHCYSDGYYHEKPMHWIRETPLQDRVFRAVMLDRETRFPAVATNPGTVVPNNPAVNPVNPKAAAQKKFKDCMYWCDRLFSGRSCHVYAGNPNLSKRYSDCLAEERRAHNKCENDCKTSNPGGF